jgi:large subunit ribosomal protein L35Ae
VQFYLGKRVAYVYKVKATASKAKQFKVMWGRIQRAHGNAGVVRAAFKKNLPPSAMGATVRVMLYPSRV